MHLVRMLPFLLITVHHHLTSPHHYHHHQLQRSPPPHLASLYPIAPPPPPILLPRANLPTTPEHWAEIDSYIQATNTPALIHEGDVNLMHHVITHGLYTYLVSRFDVMPRTRCHQFKCDFLSPSKQNAIREVTAQKKQAKKELQHLRKSGSFPEEVRLLAQKFHLLVRQHSKVVKEARRLTSKASTNWMRKDCHRDIHKFASRILDEDNYGSIKPSFCKEQAEEYFSRVYSTTPKSSAILSGCQTAHNHPTP